MAGAPLVGLRNVVPVIGCTFMEGTTENGEQTIIVAQENPDRVPGFPSEGVTKEVLEACHLASYRADSILQKEGILTESPSLGMATLSGHRPRR